MSRREPKNVDFLGKDPRNRASSENTLLWCLVVATIVIVVGTAFQQYENVLYMKNGEFVTATIVDINQQQKEDGQWEETISYTFVDRTTQEKRSGRETIPKDQRAWFDRETIEVEYIPGQNQRSRLAKESTGFVWAMFLLVVVAGHWVALFIKRKKA